MDIPEVDPQTAAQLLEAGETTFVDVRDPASFAASHVPGAHHVTDETLEAFLRETDRQSRIVVYCYHGISSLGGAAYFREQGFQDVCSMSGGFEAWRGRYPESGSAAGGA